MRRALQPPARFSLDFFWGFIILTLNTSVSLHLRDFRRGSNWDFFFARAVRLRTGQSRPREGRLRPRSEHFQFCHSHSIELDRELHKVICVDAIACARLLVSTHVRFANAGFCTERDGEIDVACEALAIANERSPCSGVGGTSTVRQLTSRTSLPQPDAFRRRSRSPVLGTTENATSCGLGVMLRYGALISAPSYAFCNLSRFGAAQFCAPPRCVPWHSSRCVPFHKIIRLMFLLIDIHFVYVTPLHV